MRMRIHAILASVLLATLLALPAAGTVSIVPEIEIVPEINPATISGGLALLAGGFLFVVSRLRRK